MEPGGRRCDTIGGMTATAIPAVLFHAPGEVRIASLPRPACTAGTILCRTRYSIISAGTELRTLRGEQEGATFPLVPGYAWVGQVLEAAPDVAGFAPGDWVSGRAATPLAGVGSTWGGHAAVHASPVAGYAAAVKLPAGAEPLDYVLTELAAISWRGVSMCVPGRDETAVVCGQGIIGALATLWLAQAGVRVVATDLDPARLERARRLGALAVDGRAADAADRIRTLAGGPVDIAVEASASLAGARLAAGLLRQPQAHAAAAAYRAVDGPGLASYWPRLCLLASYTRRMDLLPTGLVDGEGAMVLHPRDRRVQDRLAVIDRIRAGVLKTADFVAAPVPFSQAPEAYRMLRDEPARALSCVLDWS